MFAPRSHILAHPFFAPPRVRFSSLALAVAFVGGTTSVWSQSDDFNDGNDTGWTRYDPLAAVGAPATFTFPGGGYGIASAVSPNPATFGPSRAGSLRNDQTYTDFTVQFDLVDWNNTLEQSFGALARISQAGLGTTDGYAFTYDTGGGTGGSIDISRINNEAPTGLGTTALTLNPANDYRFVFIGSGNVLVGQVYDLANPSTPLATVAGTDTQFASGANGLVVFANAATGTTAATFDNFVAVPEPSTIGLLLAGGLGIFTLRRRDQKSAR